jgi:hypothetical protein
LWMLQEFSFLGEGAPLALIIFVVAGAIWFVGNILEEEVRDYLLAKGINDLRPLADTGYHETDYGQWLLAKYGNNPSNYNAAVNLSKGMSYWLLVLAAYVMYPPMVLGAAILMTILTYLLVRTKTIEHRVRHLLKHYP